MLARPDCNARRPELARSAVVACACSVAWAALAGVTSVAAGAMTGSLALLAFGLDSVVDGSASAALMWRFRLELRREGRPVHAERTAARIVAAAMLAAAVYVVSQAVRALITGVHPGWSVTGIALLARSLVVLPVLGYLKLRLAGQLRSRALRGDGVLSAAGAALAAAALAGLALDRSLGWWWADPAAVTDRVVPVRRRLAHASRSRLTGLADSPRAPRRRSVVGAKPSGPPGRLSQAPSSSWVAGETASRVRRTRRLAVRPRLGTASADTRRRKFRGREWH